VSVRRVSQSSIHQVLQSRALLRSLGVPQNGSTHNTVSSNVLLHGPRHACSPIICCLD
jgi:hypothetical protein